jgi:glycosyltransferase involved in cell wall biosynthesis
VVLGAGVSDSSTEAGSTAPRVTCVIPALSVGGAERVLTALANRWVDMGWSVTLVTFAGPSDPAFYRPDPRVVEQRLDLFASSRSPLSAIPRNLGRLRRLRRSIAASAPDAVLSFMDRTNVLALLATVGQPWPVVVSERTNPSVSPGRAWALLRSIAYRRATRVVVQTASARDSMPARLRHKVAVIPNPALEPGFADPADPLSEPAFAGSAATGGSGPEGAGPRSGTTPEPDGADGVDHADRIIALGRLVPAKGFDLLLRAFAGVHDAVPTARLEIWGDGPERRTLEDLVRELGLVGVVRLPGETHDPAAALARGCLVALASRHEGFPNVLLEAMMQGIPTVAFDCQFGPAEIIRDGVDGRLVPAGDVDALGAAMRQLLADSDERERMGIRAREVGERFSLETVGRAWDALLLQRGSVKVAA